MKFSAESKVKIMKTTRINSFLTLTFAFAIFLGVTLMANGQSTNMIPLINLQDIGIGNAIECLARQAGINFIIDPKLFPKGEPKITIAWTNISANDALSRLLKENSLVLVENKVTTVAIITDTKHVSNVVDENLLGSDTSLTNNFIPLIHFHDVRLDEALKGLIEQGHIKVMLDPKVASDVDSSRPTLNILSMVSVSWGNLPMISFRWENLTAKQAIVALCENYDLVIVKDSATGEVSIKPKN
jgi:hypothetical protein